MPYLFNYGTQIIHKTNMKHIHIILLLVLGVTACNNAPKEKNDLEKDGLKGKVKSVQEVQFNNCSEIEKGLPSSVGTRKEYNTNGYMTGKTEYLFGLIGYSTSTTYQYNEDNLLVGELSDGYLLSARKSYEYDESNKVFSAKQYYTTSGALRYTESYSYDTKGNLTEELMHTVGEENVDMYTGKKNFSKVDRTEKYLYKYEYDKENNVIMVTEEKVPTETYFEKYSIIKEYDKMQNILSERKIIQIADSLGNMVDVVSKEDLYTYNAEDRLIKEIHIERNSPDKPNINNETITHEYNSKGILTYSHGDIIKPDGEYEINITYEYDDHDNWIRKIYKNTNGCFIVEREINYYGEPEKTELVVLLEKVKEQSLIEQYCSIESARQHVEYYMNLNYPDWEICTKIKITKINPCVFNVQFQVINPHTTMRQYGIIDKEQIIAEVDLSIENYSKFNFRIVRGTLY